MENEFLGFNRITLKIRGKHYQGYWHHVHFPPNQGGENHISLYFPKKVADSIMERNSDVISFDDENDCYFIDLIKQPSKMKMLTADGWRNLYCLSGLMKALNLRETDIHEYRTSTLFTVWAKK